MAEFKPLDDKAFNRTAVGKQHTANRPRAISARFDKRSHRVSVRLDSGIEFLFDPKDALGLRDASAEDLAGIRIEGLGGTLHVPRLDADFSVAGLLEGFLGPLDWTRREARAEASRENGKRGGRPKKTLTPAA